MGRVGGREVWAVAVFVILVGSVVPAAVLVLGAYMPGGVGVRTSGWGESCNWVRLRTVVYGAGREGAGWGSTRGTGRAAFVPGSILPVCRSVRPIPSIRFSNTRVCGLLDWAPGGHRCLKSSRTDQV